MKLFRNLIGLFIALAIVPGIVLAQSNPSAYVTFAEGTTPSIISKTGNSLRIGSQSTDGVVLVVNGSSVATVTSSGINTAAGFGLNAAPFVPTMAATPVTGTNYFAPGLNVVPTAAANTAAFIGPATPVPGQQFRIINNSGAAVRAKAAGGATLNGATAGGYISIAIGATVDCATMSTANQVCLQPVIPTPAGP